MEERTNMKDCFNNIAERTNDIKTRTIIITMLAMSNNYVYSFLCETVNVLTFFINRTLERNEVVDIFTKTIEMMGKDPKSYNNIFNDYLEEGRIAIVKDFIKCAEQRKAS